jgi:hypothetical protein
VSRMLVGSQAEDAAFLAVYNRLCVALREPQDDTGITQGVYWDALKDLSMEALETAASVLMRQPGRRFFPTTAEWRTEAERAQLARLREVVRPGRDQPWQYECESCEDTGWVGSMECDGAAGSRCGRRRVHLAHTFTRVCPCRPTNRTYQRQQKFGSGAA